MGNLLQLFVYGCDKWMACYGHWEGGGLQAPKINACISQASK